MAGVLYVFTLIGFSIHKPIIVFNVPKYGFKSLEVYRNYSAHLLIYLVIFTPKLFIRF